VVLLGLGVFEKRLFGRCVLYDCQISFDDDRGRTRALIEQALATAGRPPGAFNLKHAGDHLQLTVQYCDVHPEHRRFLSDLWKIEGVREVRPLR
jgi:hypothetical protein